VFFLIIRLVGGDRVKIKKAGFTGVALFLHLDLDANKRRFVGEHVNEPCMRYLDKVLVVPFPHACLLLPERVFPNNNRSHSFLYQEVDNALAGGVQIVVHLPVARGGNLLHLLGDTLPIRFGKAQFQLFHAFVVPLVHGFERPTVNQSRDKTLSVCCTRLPQYNDHFER
jgi:hypothetical protein